MSWKKDTCPRKMIKRRRCTVVKFSKNQHNYSQPMFTNSTHESTPSGGGAKREGTNQEASAGRESSSWTGAPGSLEVKQSFSLGFVFAVTRTDTIF